jgi:ParB family chromosome partitioning protein
LRLTSNAGKKRQAYDPDDIARGGAFVILNHDGMVRIERGFIRPGDEKPKPAGETSVAGDTEGGDGQALQQDENGKGRAPPTRTMTTARCRIVLFVT